MKRFIFILWSLFASLTISAVADDVIITSPPKIKKGDGSNQGHRAPAILPVEIGYNTETSASVSPHEEIRSMAVSVLYPISTGRIAGAR